MCHAALFQFANIFFDYFLRIVDDYTKKNNIPTGMGTSIKDKALLSFDVYKIAKRLFLDFILLTDDMSVSWLPTNFPFSTKSIGLDLLLATLKQIGPRIVLFAEFKEVIRTNFIPVLMRNLANFGNDNATSMKP